MKQPRIPRYAHCEFCSRRTHGQYALVGPIRGQTRVAACSSWEGLKPGKAPCAYVWQRMDDMFRTYRPRAAETEKAEEG